MCPVFPRRSSLLPHFPPANAKVLSTRVYFGADAAPSEKQNYDPQLLNVVNQPAAALEGPAPDVEIVGGEQRMQHVGDEKLQEMLAQVEQHTPEHHAARSCDHEEG